ncbi:ANTAR domain-containing protein [Cellulomonas shaoxiangyii]|uniref:ANTAR domain-containing protein n=1 Tax=Cellulomonas shaoxiangyii TaxID=2566013 RepID=A0A4P7SI21_9CELL|nr:ANTAR domain-containing protein [Cellulomonas shaoxiangyii]QCB93712.1 ANTAR domain-containing protein [Cellulomonas shaoxiangyii]TGY80113.1 ANTAR domain-containing protein [Cellulomonas shaoxiangyii]
MSTTIRDDRPVGRDVPAPLSPRLRYVPSDGSWWWSPECWALHGFQAGEVVLTTELVLAHVDPQDRDRWWATLSGATDQPVPGRFRMRDAQGAEHHVAAVCRRTDDGALEADLVDVTALVAAEGSRLASAQIAASAASRATIEQAKGLLSAAFGVPPEVGFAVLREASMRSNVSLRTIAEGIVEHVVHRAVRVESLAAALEPYLLGVGPGDVRDPA